MPVRFLCPHCNQLLAVASRKAGAQVNCPKCQAAIIVPDGQPSDSGATSSDDFRFSRSGEGDAPSELIAPTVITTGASRQRMSSRRCPDS